MKTRLTTKKTTPRAKFILSAVISAAMIAWLPSAQAQGDEIITIGDVKSPVLQKVIMKSATKTTAKTLISTVKRNLKAQPSGAKGKNKATKQALRERLRNIKAVAMDLSAVTPSDDDKLLIEAAQQAGVPVILEKVSGKKMAELFGMGTAADLVVVESRKNGGQIKLNIWKDDDSTVKKGKVESIKLKLSSNLTPEQKTKLKELEKQKPTKNAKSNQKQQRQSNTPSAAQGEAAAQGNGYGQATQEVENILQNRPFSQGAQDLGNYSSFCDGKSTACKEVAVNLNPIYWCPEPDGICDKKPHLSPNMWYGLYATPQSKWIVIRSEGSVGAELMSDQQCNKGFFLESFKASFSILDYVPNGWVLDQASPGNANNEGKLVSSTGFEFGIDTSGPSAGYSQSTSTYQNLSDWALLNTIRPPDVDWEFKLSAVNAGQTPYNNWDDIIERGIAGSATGSMHGLPVMSTSGFQPRAEVVYRGPADAIDYIEFLASWEANVRHTWCEVQGLIVTPHSQLAKKTTNHSWWILTNQVSLPTEPIAEASVEYFPLEARGGGYLNIKSGRIEVSLIDLSDPSARWKKVPVPDTEYVQLQNREQPDLYLHIENGHIEVSALGNPGWHSAQWKFSPGINPGDGKLGYVFIANRWKSDQYLKFLGAGSSDVAISTLPSSSSFRTPWQWKFHGSD